jgi:hypothetical protein
MTDADESKIGEICVFSSDRVLKDTGYIMEAKCFYLLLEPCNSPNVSSNSYARKVFLPSDGVVFPAHNDLGSVTLLPGEELLVPDPHHIP